jgi:hypothetical protein
MAAGRGTPEDRSARERNPKRSCALDSGPEGCELPQVGTASLWGGTLLFSSGVLFVCADGGTLLAVDSANERRVAIRNECFQSFADDFEFDGKQYIAVAAGQNILSFGPISVLKSPQFQP